MLHHTYYALPTHSTHIQRFAALHLPPLHYAVYVMPKNATAALPGCFLRTGHEKRDIVWGKVLRVSPVGSDESAVKNRPGSRRRRQAARDHRQAVGPVADNEA